MNQVVFEGLNAFGRIGTSYRVPTFDDLGYTLSGVELVTQTSSDQEIGLRWKGATSKVEVRAYLHELNNQIGYDSLISNPTTWDPMNRGANVNFDPSQKRGVEVSFNHAINRNSNLRLNISARESKFVAGANAGSLPSKHGPHMWTGACYLAIHLLQEF